MRTRTLLGLATVLAPWVMGAPEARAQAVRTGGGAAGFAATSLPRNDDGSTNAVNIGFNVNFAGQTWTQLFVNNNGNVTFGMPRSTYTPTDLTHATGFPIIAAFFADVDTRAPGSALTSYGTGTIDGRQAFGVDWFDPVAGNGVGYFNTHDDKLNVFQLALINRGDTGAGNFDIEFDFNRVLWETGDFSGGTNGFGGTSAAVGYSDGTGAPGTFGQLNGSLVNGAFLDNGPAGTRLIGNSQGSTVLGRYIFNVRQGAVTVPPPPVTATPEPATMALVATGLAGVFGATRRRKSTGTANT